MKRLIVDMDDVLADATGRLIDLYEKEFGVRVTRESMNHKEDRERFPDNEAALRFVFQKGFFSAMSVNEHAQEVMKELNKKYEVFVVSSAMEFPNSLAEKLEWLKEHFPFLNWKQFVFCGKKSVVHGDYMIDDLPHNLETFNGEKLLFSAPHNLQYNHLKRVHGWKEVGEILLG
ncbi:MAG TPA: 5'(3')-deoxyribonucleotidase [Cyclobacteriaceae bacterium]|jgi:5'(3')-deoxyribonucleotidase|nr:5'(3')-deoxyribonucleotidase [Cyclobacteriaceae bacterium]